MVTMDNSIRKKSYNIGVDVLKISSCAGVVLLHFGSDARYSLFSVPIFMLIAFVFSKKLLMNGKIDDLFLRLRRLAIPFIFWGFAYWSLLSIKENRFSVMNLLSQLTIGVPCNPPLYFLFLLLVNTILIYFIFRLKWRYTVLGIIIGTCFLVQYLGLNSKLFQMLPFMHQAALGRFSELLPFAISGALFSCLGREWVWLVGSCVPFCVMGIFGIRFTCSGFSYQGIYMFLGTITICASLIWVGRMYTFLFPEKIKSWIHFFSTLTPGIYYIHLLIGKTLELFAERVQRDFYAQPNVFI